MAEQTTKRRGRHRLLRWAFYTFGAGVLAIVGVFMLLGAWANSRRLPPELLAPPAEIVPPAVAEKLAMHTGEAAPTTQPLAATQPVTFEDYLRQQLASDPNLEAAAAYLELQTAWTREKINEQLEQIFYQRDSRYGWLPLEQPLSATQADWLRAHGAFLELALRLAESEGFPLPGLADRVAAARQAGLHMDSFHGQFFLDYNNPPEPDFLLFFSCAHLLAHDGLQRARAGDWAGAKRACLATFRLGEKLMVSDRLFSPLLAQYSTSIGTRALCCVLEKEDRPALPPAAARELLATLEPLHDHLYPRGMMANALTSEYLIKRTALISLIAASPWNSPIYGYDLNGFNIHRPLFGLPEKYTWRIHAGDDLPRVDLMIFNRLQALKNKRHAPERLREFDGWWKNELTQAGGDYPSFAAAHRVEDYKIFLNFLFRASLAMVPSDVTRAVEAEARFNLVRVALRARVDDGATSAPVVTTTTTLAYDDPWRDPFTEKPFRVASIPASDAGTTTTLIWSPGPDLEDQRGQITYDPTNGTTSTGDLAIRVPCPAHDKDRQ